MQLAPIDLRSAQRRITGTLFVTESLFSAAFIASITLLSINAVTLGGSDALSGVPSTVQLVGRASMAVPIGWLMDRAGRRPGLMLGYFVGAIAMLVGAFAIGWGSFWVLCLSSLLAGMAMGASQQSRFIASEVWSSQRRSRVIGFIVFAGTVGAIGGPLLVGPTSALATQNGLAANAGPYLAAVLLALSSMVLAFLLLRPEPLELGRRFDASGGGVALVGDNGRSLRTIFSGRVVQLAVATMVVGQLVMTLIMVITPVHMHHQNHTNADVSLVFMAHTIGMFGFAAVNGWLIDRLGIYPMIAFGAALLLISSVMAAIAANLVALALALFLLGLGWNFCFVAGSTLLTSALHPRERGRAQGANDMLVALSSGTGSLGTGVVFAAGGMVAVASVGLALTLLFVAVAAWLGLRQAAPVTG